MSAGVRLSKSCIGDAERTAVMRVLDEEFLGMGKEVGQFEEEIRAYIGDGREVVCVSTGTAALHLALQAAGVGHGDEVLVPTLTYVASFQAVGATGARPVPCDVDPDSGFISLKEMGRKLSKKTKAIMPVHYASHAPSLERVYEFAQVNGLRVVEDAAHAFGCTRESLRVGARGDLVCFSFDGIKNITSGEGGAVVTGDSEAANKIRDARLLGVEKDTEMRLKNSRSWEFEVRNQGWRYHMSNLMAAIGREQLKRIEEFRRVRQMVWRQYEKGFAGHNGIKLMFEFDPAIHPHIIPVLVGDGRRDALREHLISHGIECGIQYKPNHLLARYAASDCPTADDLYERLLTLPCHADMDAPTAERVVTQVMEFFG